MSSKSQVAGSVVAGFPSPAEQYLEPPLDLNELLVKRPATTFFVRVEVEQYSIDEAFIHPPTTEYGNLMEYGKSVRAQILQWVGIPCGVGFAKTKTLAKIANHIGKKRPEGVFVMPDDPTEILAKLPTDEVRFADASCETCGALVH